jgi:hypothetical protein
VCKQLCTHARILVANSACICDKLCIGKLAYNMPPRWRDFGGVALFFGKVSSKNYSPRKSLIPATIITAPGHPVVPVGEAFSRCPAIRR